MIVDGKKIAEGIYQRVKTQIEERGASPRLGIFTCDPNFETKKYLALKQRKAAEVGIDIVLISVPPPATTDQVVALIESSLQTVDGAILQLPFPERIDKERVLSAIPPLYDVDALNSKNTLVLSPVVGACKAILEENRIDVEGKHVTILGSGKLVGLPASAWFQERGAHVRIVTKDTEDITYYTRHADIIVCGAGDPEFLKPDMVQEGVIILDAGTSEAGGMLRGDADPACADKSSLFTPVPGGIGPITVAILFENLLTLMAIRARV